jgi:hypothetical protein
MLLYHLTLSESQAPSVHGLSSFYILSQPWIVDGADFRCLILLIDVVNSTVTKFMATVRICADYDRFEAFYFRLATLIMCSDNVYHFSQIKPNSFDFVKIQAVNNTLVNVHIWVVNTGKSSY